MRSAEVLKKGDRVAVTEGGSFQIYPQGDCMGTIVKSSDQGVIEGFIFNGCFILKLDSGDSVLMSPSNVKKVS